MEGKHMEQVYCVIIINTERNKSKVLHFNIL